MLLTQSGQGASGFKAFISHVIFHLGGLFGFFLFFWSIVDLQCLLVSAVLQSESVIHICTYIRSFFFRSLWVFEWLRWDKLQ